MSLADGPAALAVGPDSRSQTLVARSAPSLRPARGIAWTGRAARFRWTATSASARSPRRTAKFCSTAIPIYLKTVLDQGYWPESNLTPPSDEAIQDDIRTVKELGFNGVRKHQKVEDPRFLYWADRMGLLVAAEMANAYLFNEDAVARMTREWIEVVARDYNHPSHHHLDSGERKLGCSEPGGPRQQAHLKALYYLTKSLDNTRLVIDNDGWEHTEVTDLFAIHDYTRTGKEFQRRFQNITQGLPLPLYGKLYSAPGHRYNGSPILLWEFGGVGYVLPEDLPSVPENSWGYSGVEADCGSGA